MATDPSAAPAEIITRNLSREVHDGRALYVKEFRSTGDARLDRIADQRVQREVGVLHDLAQCNDVSPRLGRLELVDSDLSARRIAVGEVQGTQLRAFLLQARGRSQRRSALRAAWHAGRWLRLLREIPIDRLGDAFRPDEALDPVAYAELRLRRIRSNGYPWPNQSQQQDALRQVRRLHEATEAADCELVICHCDYCPANMIWNGQVLTPIDFEMCRLDYPLVDITYFIHRIVMLNVQFPWLRLPTDTLAKAALDGLGRGEAVRTPMYRLMMARHWTNRLSSLVSQKPARLRGRLHNAWIRRTVLKNLQQTLFGD